MDVRDDATPAPTPASAGADDASAAVSRRLRVITIMACSSATTRASSTARCPI